MITQSRILELAYAQVCTEWNITLYLASKGIRTLAETPEMGVRGGMAIRTLMMVSQCINHEKNKRG